MISCKYMKMFSVLEGTLLIFHYKAYGSADVTALFHILCYTTMIGVTPNCHNKTFNPHFRPNVKKIFRCLKMQIEITQMIKLI